MPLLDNLEALLRVQFESLGSAADVASALKDLQLLKLFGEVKRSGDEKARLLRKIDALERSVAKMRRGRGHASRL